MKVALLIAMAALVTALPAGSASPPNPPEVGCSMTHDWPPSQVECHVGQGVVACHPFVAFSPSVGASCGFNVISHCVGPLIVATPMSTVAATSECEVEAWVQPQPQPSG